MDFLFWNEGSIGRISSVVIIIATVVSARSMYNIFCGVCIIFVKWNCLSGRAETDVRRFGGRLGCGGERQNNQSERSDGRPRGLARPLPTSSRYSVLLLLPFADINECTSCRNVHNLLCLYLIDLVPDVPTQQMPPHSKFMSARQPQQGFSDSRSQPNS